MAEDEGQDKTEAPTPRRREEARKQGQIAFSPDLVGSVVLLAGIIALYAQGPNMAAVFLNAIRAQFAQPLPVELDAPGAQELFYRQFLLFASVLLPFLIVLVIVGVAVNLAQVGLNITPERLEPDISKLSPIKGFSRLFSVAAVVKGLLAFLKLAVLVGVIYWVMRPRLGIFAALATSDVAGGADLAWNLLTRLALSLAGVFVIIGVIDFFYQYNRLERSLMMTRQELKEELKREEGDPLVRQRMRQLARERARQRMLAEVPKATVVVTNPTHYAVALLYKPGMTAPRLVIKGAGDLAARIVERARNAGVPIVERPSLARTLFRQVPEGREIPADLFLAVAEIIAFVLRLRNPGLKN